MKGKAAETDKVICPYFIEHGGRHILCEGLEEGCTARFTWRTNEGKDRHMYGFCMTLDYMMCEYALSLDRFKYGDDK